MRPRTESLPVGSVSGCQSPEPILLPALSVSDQMIRGDASSRGQKWAISMSLVNSSPVVQIRLASRASGTVWQANRWYASGVT